MGSFYRNPGEKQLLRLVSSRKEKKKGIYFSGEYFRYRLDRRRDGLRDVKEEGVEDCVAMDFWLCSVIPHLDVRFCIENSFIGLFVAARLVDQCSWEDGF